MRPSDEKGTNVSHAELFIDARASRRVCVSLAIVLFGVFLLVWQASPVFARQARLFTGGFGAASSTPSNPYPLSGASGVAVDEASHDVYVSDLDNHRVEKFGPGGEFVLMFGKEVNLTKVLSAGSEAEQNVCTTASLDTCQAGAVTSSPGGFENPAYVAVDNSSGESKGDVYVADTTGRFAANEHGLVSKFDSSGHLVSSWGDHVPLNGQLDGSNVKSTGPFGETIEGPFGALAGIAVDTSGNLWVASRNGQMFEFHQDWSFIAGWQAQALENSQEGIAVDSEDNLYASGEAITKLDAHGKKIGQILQFGEGSVTGLTVDPQSDDLYSGVSGVEGRRIQRYDASCRPSESMLGETRCTPVESFGSAQLQLHNSSGLAVDPSTPADTLYAAQAVQEGFLAGEVVVFSVETVPDVSTVKASGFTSTSATLHGNVNPSGVELKAGIEGCRFEWGETEAYGHVAPCDESAAQIGPGSSSVEVGATITGLQQGRTYHFRLVVGNANDVNSVIDEPSRGADLAFGPPAIESASAIGVAADSATVQAQVNPNNVDTRVRVEYGSEAGVYGNSTSEAELGAGGAGELAPLQLVGLVPHTVYHYRVVAENALGEGAEAALSTDRVFLTQRATTGFALPDGRGWELVSPPDKHGSELLRIGEYGVVQASVMGDAFSYLANASTEAEPAGRPLETQVLSRRTSGGWESQDIAAPHETASGVVLGAGEEYRLFSSDLSLGIVQPRGFLDPRMSAEASELTPFLRTNFPSGDVGSPCLVSCYRPLVTGAPGYANVPSGTIFGSRTRCGLNACAPLFLGASSDLSHVVLESQILNSALTEGAPDLSLYEWSGGSLALVSVLPDSHPASTSSQPRLGENHVVRNSVSADGSRIVWSDNKEHLYVRDSVREQTVQVGSGAVGFQTASSDGSKILFTEGDQSQTHGDLRECDIVESGGELRCEVTDLTPVGAGENPGVLGVIPGASDDASYVYFVSNAALENNGVAIPGAQPGECGSTTTGVTCNLYVRHDGTTKLVAELSSKDRPDWGTRIPGLVARVSPAGRWFEFMSDRSLTGYDNRDSVTGKPDEEVYLYDAVANGGQGMVVCASCDPTGARPHGAENKHGRLAIEMANIEFEAGQGFAAHVPSWIVYGEAEALYQSRFLSDSGRLFFDSIDGLVAQDSNGTGDVYEYEPAGVGDCTTSSTTFATATDGCVGLISSGISREESVFMDASENGSDVFFLSFAQLSHRDIDGIGDVYDARVGGGFAEAPPPPVCEGDACQSPVSAPEDPTPGSLTYNGPGNPSAPSSATLVGKHKARVLSRVQKLAKALGVCRSVRSRRVRGECVSRARKRYGRAKAGRATTTKKGKR
jgi:hypothetical protein